MKIRIYLSIALLCLFSSLCRGEYAELVELQKSSLEVITVYGEKLASLDPKFEGIVNFGKALKAIDDPEDINIPELTYKSRDYWRATMEMSAEDPSVLFAHAYLYAAKGELAWADAYFLIGSLTMDKSRSSEYELYTRLRAKVNEKAAPEIEKGVALHNNMQLDEAIAVYDQVLEGYPNCAMAYYEKGFAYLMKSKEQPEFKRNAMQMYAECRKRDPFFWKAYQGDDQEILRKLQVYFKLVHPFIIGKERTGEGFVAFAEGCEEMGLYPIAAHARWKLALLDKKNATAHLKKLLDLIEKSGCKEAGYFREKIKFNEEPASEQKEKG
jgi:tetratricopeptide (TPR) repeat protein